MSGVGIRQRAAKEGQMGSRRGQEGWPAPPYRASWSTDKYKNWLKEKKGALSRAVVGLHPQHTVFNLYKPTVKQLFSLQITDYVLLFIVL